MTRKYTIVKDELTCLIESFPQNPLITTWQRTMYLNLKGARKNLTHEQFAKSLAEKDPGSLSKNSIRIPLKLALDNASHAEPVGSLGHKAARAFWYHDNDGHIFVPLKDMVRICFFFHCDLFETFRLCLKNEWERYLAKKRGYKLNLGTPFSEFIPGEEPIDNDFTEFKPDITAIVDQITYLYQMGCKTGKDSENILSDSLKPEIYDDKKILNNLAREFVLLRLMIEDKKSLAIKKFKKNKIEEIRENQKSGKKKQHTFLKKKTQWLDLQEEHGQILYDIEILSLNQAHTKKRYLDLFGREYIALQELIFKITNLKRRILYKEQKQELTEKEIKALVDQSEAAAKKDIDDLKYWASSPTLYTANTAGLSDIDSSDLSEWTGMEYDLKIRQLLKDLEKMLHPDLMQHHKNYKNLTKEHFEALKILWDKIMTIRANDCIYPEMSMGSLHMIVAKLEHIRTEAKTILDSLGIPGSSGYIITGKTIDERISWLEQHISLYEDKVQQSRENLYAISQNQQIRDMKAVLNAKGSHESYLENLRNEIQKAEHEKSTLESKWESLWV